MGGHVRGERVVGEEQARRDTRQSVRAGGPLGARVGAGKTVESGAPAPAAIPPPPRERVRPPASTRARGEWPPGQWRAGLSRGEPYRNALLEVLPQVAPAAPEEVALRALHLLFGLVDRARVTDATLLVDDDLTRLLLAARREGEQDVRRGRGHLERLGQRGHLVRIGDVVPPEARHPLERRLLRRCGADQLVNGNLRRARQTTAAGWRQLLCCVDVHPDISTITPNQINLTQRNQSTSKHLYNFRLSPTFFCPFQHGAT